MHLINVGIPGISETVDIHLAAPMAGETRICGTPFSLMACRLPGDSPTT